MKTLVLMFAALAANAQSFGLAIPVRAIVHPISTYKSAPKDVWFRRASAGLLEAVNFGDYETTKIGVFNGPYCEQNPIFLTAPCVINKSRFRGVKMGIAMLGLAEEAPELFPQFRSWSHRRDYEQAMGVINFAGSIPLGIATVKNAIVLKQ